MDVCVIASDRGSDGPTRASLYYRGINGSGHVPVNSLAAPLSGTDMRFYQGKINWEGTKRRATAAQAVLKIARSHWKE